MATMRTANRIMPAAVLTLMLASSFALSSSRAPHRLSDCYFFPNWEAAACERSSDGRFVLSRLSIADVYFRPEGLGSLIVKDELCFVNRQGKTAPAFHFDNGTDYMVEGLARTVKDGKVGFVNTQLDQVVAPAWDFATSFEQGVAEVCIGCVSRPISPGSEYHHYIWREVGVHRQAWEGNCTCRI
jgi:WG containing repeat